MTRAVSWVNLGYLKDFYLLLKIHAWYTNLHVNLSSAPNCLLMLHNELKFTRRCQHLSIYFFGIRVKIQLLMKQSSSAALLWAYSCTTIWKVRISQGLLVEWLHYNEWMPFLRLYTLFEWLVFPSLPICMMAPRLQVVYFITGLPRLSVWVRFFPRLSM